MTKPGDGAAPAAPETIEKAELQRRVRGMLASIRSLLRRTAEEAVSIEDYRMKVEGRLDAIARVQTNFLFNAESEVDLHQLVADELVAFGLHEGSGFAIRGPAVRLRERTAQSLALALHQLAAHSVGPEVAPTASPALNVSWCVSASGPEPRLTLLWVVPPADGEAIESPNALGFAEHALRYEIGASIRWHDEEHASRCTIDIPKHLGRSAGVALWRDVPSGE